MKEQCICGRWLVEEVVCFECLMEHYEKFMLESNRIKGEDRPMHKITKQMKQWQEINSWRFATSKVFWGVFYEELDDLIRENSSQKECKHCDYIFDDQNITCDDCLNELYNKKEVEPENRKLEIDILIDDIEVYDETVAEVLRLLNK